MFYVWDYPDWVDEIHSSLREDTEVSISDRVWESIKNSEQQPHIGNATALIKLQDVVSHILSSIEDGYMRQQINSLFNLEINGGATYLNFDNEDYDKLSDLKKAVKEKIDELEEEEE